MRAAWRIAISSGKKPAWSVPTKSCWSPRTWTARQPRGLAPGADDDASGAVGVLTAAEVLAPYQFQRTLRFVLFTGEEQGLCGSEIYARDAAAAGEAIVAVYNMDMIAWTGAEPICGCTPGGPTILVTPPTWPSPIPL